MKKILSLTIIAIVALIVFAGSVNAADVSTEADLKSAVLADGTVTLASDIELTSSLEIGKNVTINLNGYNITAKDGMTDDSLVIVLHGGALTVEGNGSISAINSNASARIAVKMTKAGNTADFINNNSAMLTLISGTLKGTSFGISGNGNPDRVNTIIDIQGGTVEGGSTGIYHPQEGMLMISGGTVKGSTGIEMRSGSLEVTGGTIIGTGAPTDVTPNGNGTTTDGAGIAIAQHTTEKEIDVFIMGGKVQGYSAIYESNPQSNSSMEKITMDIIGGEFETINGGTVAVYSEDKTDFISGGTFNSDVSAYVDSSLETVEDEDGNFYVGVLHTINIYESENGKAKASLDKAVEGQLIKITFEPDEGYKAKSISFNWATGSQAWTSVNGFEMDYPDGWSMVDADVDITVEFEKIEEDVITPDDSEDDELVSGPDDSEEDEVVEPEGEEDEVVEPEDEEDEVVEPEGEEDEVVEPEDEEDEVVEPEKDDTPKTGSVDIVVYISTISAVISLAGIVIVKKYTK